jgi:hypothetical protein
MTKTEITAKPLHERVKPVSQEELRREIITQEQLESKLTWVKEREEEGQVILKPAEVVQTIDISDIPLYQENLLRLKGIPGYSGIIEKDNKLYAVYVNKEPLNLSNIAFFSEDAIRQISKNLEEARKEYEIRERLSQDLMFKSAVVSNILFSLKSHEYVATYITNDIQRRQELMMQQVNEMLNSNTFSYVLKQSFEAPFSILGLPMLSYGLGYASQVVGKTGQLIMTSISIPATAGFVIQGYQAYKEGDYTKLVALGIASTEALTFGIAGMQKAIQVKQQQYEKFIQDVFEKGYIKSKVDVSVEGDKFLGQFKYEYITEPKELTITTEIKPKHFGFLQEKTKVELKVPVDFKLKGKGIFAGEGQEAEVLTISKYTSPYGKGIIKHYEYPVVSVSEATDKGLIKLTGFSLEGATKTLAKK